jgi:hypothetical protein
MPVARRLVVYSELMCTDRINGDPDKYQCSVVMAEAQLAQTRAELGVASSAFGLEPTMCCTPTFVVPQEQLRQDSDTAEDLDQVGPPLLHR